MTERRVSTMEIMNDNDNKNRSENKKEGEDQEEEEKDIVLPGFRFHPTDEELVGFYLRRKVDKKPLRIELIKQIDLYKFDPWDLPKEASNSSGEKEWYFFCKRGRKYRNSIRPNRVTGSGFWKATGIDKAIHSVNKEPNNNYDDYCIIGLKKSLVYYRGTAGKGTKTDWMMHEFRLPPPPSSNSDHANPNHLQEAEVWTLCRIFKRTPSYRKYTPSLKDTASAAAATSTKQTNSSNSKTCSLESDNKSKPYLTSSFRTSDSSSSIIFQNHQQQQQQQQHNINVERKPLVDERSHLFLQGHLPHHHQNHQPPSSSMVTNYYNPSLLNHHHQSVEDVFANGNWDELTSVVQFAVDHPSTIYDCTLNR